MANQSLEPTRVGKPPLAASCSEYGTPSVAAGRLAGEMESTGGAIVIVMLATADVPPLR